MKNIIYVLPMLSLFGCSNNDLMYRDRDGEIKTEIAMMPGGKEYIVSKSVLVRGIFKHVDFESVLGEEMLLEANRLCGSVLKVDSITMKYGEGDVYRVKSQHGVSEFTRRNNFNFQKQMRGEVNCK